MTLQEAMQLASEVEYSGHHLVVAVGRFMLIDELVRHQDPSTLPWCVSAIARRPQPTEPNQPHVLRTRADWHELVAWAESVADRTSAQPTPPAVAPSPQPTKAQRRDDHITRQPTLF